MGDPFAEIEIDCVNIELSKIGTTGIMGATIPAEGKSFTIIPKGKYKDKSNEIHMSVNGEGHIEAQANFSSPNLCDAPILSGEWGDIRYRRLNNQDTPIAIDIQINANMADEEGSILIIIGNEFEKVRIELTQEASAL